MSAQPKHVCGRGRYMQVIKIRSMILYVHFITEFSIQNLIVSENIKYDFYMPSLVTAFILYVEHEQQ